MSLLTELFGPDAAKVSLADIKEMIKILPDVQKERRSYLLKDWARLTNTDLTAQDYKDIDA